MNLHNVKMLTMQFDNIDKRVFKYDKKHHLVIMSACEKEREEGIIFEADCVLIDAPVVITHDIIVDRLVKMQYPDGEDLALLRKGIANPQNAEFITFNENVERIKTFIKSIRLL